MHTYITQSTRKNTVTRNVKGKTEEMVLTLREIVVSSIMEKGIHDLQGNIITIILVLISIQAPRMYNSMVIRTTNKVYAVLRFLKKKLKYL